MEQLQNLRHGILYTLDTSYFSEVQYTKQSSNTVIFILPEELTRNLPDQLFLIPDGKAYTFAPCRFVLSENLTLYRTDASGKPYYLVRGTTTDTAEARDELRIQVSIDIDIDCPNFYAKVPVTIKDLSASGLLFVSDQKFEPGMNFSFEFPDTAEYPEVTARIVKKRPVRVDGLTGYGCQFLHLSPKLEAEIRKFVFRQDVLYKKKF